MTAGTEIQVFEMRAVLGRVVEKEKLTAMKTRGRPAGYFAVLTRTRTASDQTRRWRTT